MTILPAGMPVFRLGFLGKMGIALLVGLGRACFFWPGPSPSPFFSARAEPGPQIISLEPIRAKKNSIRAYFEPQIYECKLDHNVIMSY